MKGAVIHGARDVRFEERGEPVSRHLSVYLLEQHRIRWCYSSGAPTVVRWQRRGFRRMWASHRKRS